METTLETLENPYKSTLETLETLAKIAVATLQLYILRTLIGTRITTVANDFRRKSSNLQITQEVFCYYLFFQGYYFSVKKICFWEFRNGRHVDHRFFVGR